MNSELEELYQQVILDHSKRPRNVGEIPGAVQVRGDNPSCGDEIELSVRFGVDGAVDEMKFRGHGCAISMASASMMTLKLTGRSRTEASEIARAFHDLVTIDSTVQPPKQLGDLRLMGGVRKFPQRVKCAMLAWRAFEQAVQTEQGGGTVTTEA